MRKEELIVYVGLVLAFSVPVHSTGQVRSGLEYRIDQVVRDYMTFSPLGNSGSVFMDEATMASFRSLFEPDANLYWDLFRGEQDKVPYLLTVDEYIDSARVHFSGKKPILVYGRIKISSATGGTTACAWIHKTHHIPDESDTIRFSTIKKETNLRILLNIRNDTILIQNITEDTRLTRIRSLKAEGSWMYAGQIAGGFFGSPGSNVSDGQAKGFSFGSVTGYQAGLSMDIRLDRRKAEGWLLDLGLGFSHQHVSVNITDYCRSHRQVFDPGENAFEASVFDRSPEIKEKITLSGAYLPVTVKWYASHRFYIKAGIQLNLLWQKTSASCTLSHTGGGRYILLKEASFPPEEQHWFYLDENHEMDDPEYGFFRNREVSVSAPDRTSAVLSGLIGLGYEARIGKMTVGIEPWISIGINPLIREQADSYSIYPASDYKGFLSTCNSPGINSFGIRILFGKVFYR